MLASTAVISSTACPATGIGDIPGGQAVTIG
jgi:hypothetical protein